MVLMESATGAGDTTGSPGSISTGTEVPSGEPSVTKLVDENEDDDGWGDDW